MENTARAIKRFTLVKPDGHFEPFQVCKIEETLRELESRPQYKGLTDIVMKSCGDHWFEVCVEETGQIWHSALSRRLCHTADLFALRIDGKKNRLFEVTETVCN